MRSPGSSCARRSRAARRRRCCASLASSPKAGGPGSSSASPLELERAARDAAIYWYIGQSSDVAMCVRVRAHVARRGDRARCFNFDKKVRDREEAAGRAKPPARSAQQTTHQPRPPPCALPPVLLSHPPSGTATCSRSASARPRRASSRSPRRASGRDRRSSASIPRRCRGTSRTGPVVVAGRLRLEIGGTSSFARAAAFSTRCPSTWGRGEELVRREAEEEEDEEEALGASRDAGGCGLAAARRTICGA